MTDTDGSGTGVATEQATADAGAASGQATDQGKQPAASGQADQGTSQPQGEQTVPYSRFKEVIDQNNALTKAAKEREDAAAAEQGKWKELAETRKADIESANAKAAAIAKRAAFIAGAAGKVADPKAAFILARDSGLLDGIEVDDDGEPKDAKAIDEAVKATIERFAFLKVDSRSFGQERGGAGGSSTPDTSKMTPREIMSLGYSRSGKGS